MMPSRPQEAGQPRELAVLFLHTTAVLFLLTVGYYLLPVGTTRQPDGLLRIATSVVALGLVVILLRRQTRQSRRALTRPMQRVQGLLTALYVLVLGFALTYAVIAEVTPGQIVGIGNRTDALYFSVTLVATVGFGDIHPAGTFGRLVVTVHMLFNLIYLGTALRLLRPAAPG